MGKKINFKQYRYFYDLGIVRMDKNTKKLERFIRGKFVETNFETDIEVRLNDGFDDLLELREEYRNEVNLLKENLYLLNRIFKKINLKNKIKYFHIKYSRKY